MLSFLIHLNVIIFDFIFHSSCMLWVLGAVLSPFHECVYFLSCQHSPTFDCCVLISIFYDFFFCSLMLHWSQDYDECVCASVKLWLFAEEEEKNEGKSGNRFLILLCRSSAYDFGVVKFFFVFRSFFVGDYLRVARVEKKKTTWTKTVFKWKWFGRFGFVIELWVGWNWNRALSSSSILN